MRLGALTLLGCICALGAWAQGLPRITGAEYTNPTTIYPHAVLGDGIEHQTLRVSLSNGQQVDLTWPKDVVFEDTAPRLVDLNGDSAPEVIVVESHLQRGARLSIYGYRSEGLVRLASGPFIGQRFRWLAPVGAADLDGDGAVEIAWVDRPHLARTLRVWRYREVGSSGALVEIAQLPGVTNHRIGERDIAGGILTCAGRPQMVVASANWSRLLAVSLKDGELAATDIGPHKDRSSFAAAMACR